jgi:hypothetical protein
MKKKAIAKELREEVETLEQYPAVDSWDAGYMRGFKVAVEHATRMLGDK